MTELTGPFAIKTTECLTQMEIVLEVLNEGVVIADEHHRIFFANSQFMEMTGVPRTSPDQICPLLISIAAPGFFETVQQNGKWS